MKQVIKNTELMEDSDLYVCLSGIENCLPGHFWGPGIIQNYSFHYIISGKGVFRSQDTLFELGPGQVFLICPNNLCYYKADEKDPWVYCWVSFNGKHAKNFVHRSGLSKDNSVFFYGINNTLINYIHLILNTAKKTKSSDIALTGLLYQLLSNIIEVSDQSPSIDKIHDWSSYYVMKAVKYIRLNYSHEISIESLAKDLGINKRYLSALFKNELNTSPQQFLINTRIDAACSLMRNKHLSIGDIARSVGYRDPLMFSRMFKKMRVISPRYYRNEVLKTS